MNINKVSIVTNEISYKKIDGVKAGSYNVQPQILRKIVKINEVPNTFGILMRVEIKNMENVTLPFNLSAEIVGVYEFSDFNDEKEIIEFLESKGVQTVYPYLRSLVSSVTTSAMLPPIFLPFIDVTKFTEIK